MANDTPARPELSPALREIARVLHDAPLFRSMHTGDVEWFARPYMNRSPEAWVTWAVDVLYQAASRADAAYAEGYAAARQEAVEDFYRRVNARAEAEMLAGRPVTGAHHRALEAEIALVMSQPHE